jgi:hypothetical protein
MTFASKSKSAKAETADNQPNAFKSAMRIATALAAKPPVWNAENRSWEYTVNTPEDVVVNELVQGLLQAAIQTLNNGELINSDGKKPYLTRDKSMIDDTITFTLPANKRDVSAMTEGLVGGSKPRVFPTHAVNHQLNTITKQLSNNWVKDAEGNYRHAQTFEGFRRFGFTPELFRNLLLEGSAPGTDVDVRLFRQYEDDDKPADIKDWPKYPVGRNYFSGIAFGVCLTPAQLEVASKAIGFLNPVRARG